LGNTIRVGNRADLIAKYKAAEVFLGPQGGKEDHIADTRAVAQKHGEAIDADPAAARRRHAVFERADVVRIEKHRLFVAFGFRLGLPLEALGLILGVIEFGKAVGQFTTGDIEFEALGNARMLIRGARKRRGFNRIIENEGGILEGGFGAGLKKRKLQPTGASAAQRFRIRLSSGRL